jgi:hypothetical protein
LNDTNYLMLYVVSGNIAYIGLDNFIVNGTTLDINGVDFNTAPSAPTATEEFNIYVPNSNQPEQTTVFNGDENGQDTVFHSGPLVIGAAQATPAPSPAQAGSPISCSVSVAYSSIASGYGGRRTPEDLERLSSSKQLRHVPAARRVEMPRTRRG